MNCTLLSNGWIVSDEERKESVPFFGERESENTARVTLPSFDRGYVELNGLSSQSDVYIGGEYSGTLFGGGLIACPPGSGRTELKISSRSAFALSSAKLYSAKGDLFITPRGVSVVTDRIAPEGAYLTATASLLNLGERVKASVTVLIYSGNRRVAKRIKNIVAFPGLRSVSVPIRVNSFIEYNFAETKRYRVEIILSALGKAVDAAQETFGISDRKSVQSLGKMLGACVSSNPIPLMSGEALAKRLLSGLIGTGVNAVRCTFIPSEDFLSAADELGLRVIVDIFSSWTHPGKDNSYLSFASSHGTRIDYAVRYLRNHPSVVMYCVGDGLEESYGRSGSGYLEDVLAEIKELDPVKPVTCVIKELVPTAGEIPEKEGNAPLSEAKLLAASRQNHLVEKLTREFRSKLDVSGFALPGGWEIAETDGAAKVALEVPGELYADAVTGMMKRDDIVGVFASDAIGPEGNLDYTCLPTGTGEYRKILSGSDDPVILTSRDKNAETAEMKPDWNYAPGETIKVRVLGSGEVAALYLNGRIVGRKITGRINRYYADFEVPYEAGTLTAVNILQGSEVGSGSIFSVGGARQIKLLTGSKTFKSEGRTADYFIDVWVLDANGNPCLDDEPGEMHVEVVGDGELVCSLSKNEIFSDKYSVKAYDGHALLAVRCKSPGSATVRVFAGGLLSGKIVLRVKE